MADTPLFNRRFIRLQAVQHLYAFYVGKQANHNGALAQIQTAFTLDVFADSLIDSAQLAQEAQQARDLFTTSLATSTRPVHDNSRVQAAVAVALQHYQREQAQDVRKLEQGFEKAIATMNQTCVRIWQLLIEWAHLAQKDMARPKLSPNHVRHSSGALAHNSLLQRLQRESNLAALVVQERASWDTHMPLVESWYHQWVQKDPLVQGYLADPAQEQQLVELLVKKIIFGQTGIQDFFTALDLNWAIHQQLVKKLVRQGLAALAQNSEKGSTLRTFGAVAQWEEAQRFYTDLVQRTWQQDEALEELIAQHSDNWTVDRITLLDKTIIKLALCEMIHFPSIPVKVSINEYIDIAKIYSLPKSSQFVNGLLDAVASTLPARSLTTAKG